VEDRKSRSLCFEYFWF